MTFLNPLGLAAGLSLPILVTFYLLKVRRTERVVSSTLLWETLRRDLAAQEPWQRLRWSALLVIQLILLGALSLALGRPATVAPAPTSRFDAIIVDTSASMQATDVAPSRFEEARRAAQHLLDQLPEGTSIALIQTEPTPRVVVPETLDHAAIARGLATLVPTDAPETLGAGTPVLGPSAADSAAADPGTISAALRIAGALARGRAGATIDLFSDGAYPHPTAWDDLIGVNLHFHPIATVAGNRAITAMALRPDPTGGSGEQLFAQVANASSQPARVSVTLSADGTPVETRPVDLPANGTQSLFFQDLPPGARLIQLRLDPPDALAADDQATLVRGQPATTPVLMVTRGDLFLEKALQAVPGLTLYQVAPRSFPSVDTSGYGILVFDGYLPDTMPTKNMLLVNPPDVPWLPLQGILRNPPITLWRSDDPTLAYVDLRPVRIARASDVKLPDWAQPSIESNGVPLGFVGTNNGQRVVGLAFDLQQSNLPLASAFPIFISNVVRFLAPPTVAQSAWLAPDTPAVLRPPPGVDRIVVDGPGNQQWVIHPTGASVQFTATNAVGLYRVTDDRGNRVVGSEQFAVDLFSANESDLRPRAQLFDRDGALPPGPADRTPIIHDDAPWLLLLVVPLMLGEWWWFHRK